MYWCTHKVYSMGGVLLLWRTTHVCLKYLNREYFKATVYVLCEHYRGLNTQTRVVGHIIL